MDKPIVYRSKFYSKMIHNTRAAVRSRPDISKIVYQYGKSFGAITTVKGKAAFKVLGKCIIKSLKNVDCVRESISSNIVKASAYSKSTLVASTVALSVKLGLEAYDRAKKNILCYDYENRLYHYILGFTLAAPKQNLEPTLRKHARVWKYNNDQRIKERIQINNNRIDKIRGDQLNAYGDEFYELENKIAQLEGENILLERQILTDKDFNEMCKSVFPYLMVESEYDTVVRTAPYSLPRKLYEAVVKNNKVVLMQKQVDQIVNLACVAGYCGIILGFGAYIGYKSIKDLRAIANGELHLIKKTAEGLVPVIWN